MRQSCLFVLMVATLVACDSQTTGNLDVMISDSAGVSLVEHSAGGWTNVAQWKPSETPWLDIGGADSIDVYNLFWVRSVARVPSGEIVVANGGTSEIRIFDHSGRYVRTIGRHGSGPGEFYVLTLAQVIRGDSIAAYDGRQGRITVFDYQGNVGRTDIIGLRGGGYLRHVFHDGAAVGKISNSVSIVGVQRPLVALTCVSCSGTPVDTIARIQERELYTPPHKKYMVDRPLGKPLETAIADSLVYIGEGDKYEIRAFTRSGILRQVLRVGVDPVQVSQQHIDEFFAQGAYAKPYKDDFRVFDDVFPEFLPAHGSLLVGAGNELWVQDYKIDPYGRSRWHVFDSDFRQLATVETPERFELMNVGADWIAGVWKDQMDVEHVRVYGLAKQ